MSRRTLAAVGGIKTASKQGWETDKGRENEGERERETLSTRLFCEGVVLEYVGLGGWSKRAFSAFIAREIGGEVSVSQSQIWVI